MRHTFQNNPFKYRFVLYLFANNNVRVEWKIFFFSTKKQILNTIVIQIDTLLFPNITFFLMKTASINLASKNNSISQAKIKRMNAHFIRAFELQ